MEGRLILITFHDGSSLRPSLSVATPRARCSHQLYGWSLLSLLLFTLGEGRFDLPDSLMYRGQPARFHRFPSRITGVSRFFQLYSRREADSGVSAIRRQRRREGADTSKVVPPRLRPLETARPGNHGGGPRGSVPQLSAAKINSQETRASVNSIDFLENRAINKRGHSHPACSPRRQWTCESLDS
jgi:hypothetical protein